MADYTSEDTNSSRMGLILGAVAIVAIVLLIFFFGSGDGGTVAPTDAAAPLAAPEADATVAPAAPEADAAPAATE